MLIGTYLIQVTILRAYRILNWTLNALDRDTLVLPPMLVPPRLFLTVMAMTVMPASQAAGQLLGAGGAGGIYLLGCVAAIYVLTYVAMLAWALHTISRKAWAMGVVFGTFGNFYAPAREALPQLPTASDTRSRRGRGKVYLPHPPPGTSATAQLAKGLGPGPVAESVEPKSVSSPANPLGPPSGAGAEGRGVPGVGRRLLRALCWPVHASSRGLQRCFPPYGHWLAQRKEAARRKKEKRLKKAQAWEEVPSRVAFLAMQCPSKLPAEGAGDMLDIAVRGLEACYKNVADPWVVAASLTDLDNYTKKLASQGGKLKTKLKAKAKGMATAWIVKHKGGQVEMVTAAEPSWGKAAGPAPVAAAAGSMLLEHEQEEQAQHLFGDTLPWDTIPVFDPVPVDKGTLFWSLVKDGLLATWTWIKVDCFKAGSREVEPEGHGEHEEGRGQQLWEQVKERGRLPEPNALYVPLPLGADSAVLEASAAQVRKRLPPVWSPGRQAILLVIDCVRYRFAAR